MRNKTLRRTVSPKGLPHTSDTEKIKILKALYMHTYNSDTSMIPMVVELFHLLGDILEGNSLDDLDFKHILRDEVYALYKIINRNGGPHD